MFKRYFAEFIWLLILFYFVLSILPPFLYKTGNEGFANSIHSVYRIFCHQRIDRSPLLFGEKGLVNFYSIEELREKDVIPSINPHVPERFSRDVYAYPYVGNEVVGYKTALCIRDLPIYFMMVIVGGIYLILCNLKRTVPKFKWLTIILLMLPMALDGTLQLVSELFGIGIFSEAYSESILKRIITGALFGIGFALFVFSNLKDLSDFGYNGVEGDPSE